MSRRAGNWFARACLNFLFCLSALSCDEAGMPLPKNPGSVAFHVTDESGAAIPDVSVLVSLENRLGVTLSAVGRRTGSDGRVTISGIPAGQQEARVTPPAAFTEGPDPLSRLINVVEGQTVNVSVRLRRR